MKNGLSTQVNEKIKTLKITSPSFSFMSLISPKFTCDAENINPALQIEEFPLETKSLVVIVEDPDAPRKTWVHWLLWNVSPSATIKWNILPSFLIKENSAPGIEGKNDFGNIRYDGPCPPYGKHRYSFKVYALNETIDLKRGSSKEELEMKMTSLIVGFGELIGIYGRVL